MLVLNSPNFYRHLALPRVRDLVCHHKISSTSKPITSETTSKSTSNFIGKTAKKASSRKDFLFGISACHAALLSGRRKIFKLYLDQKLQEHETTRPQLLETINEAKKREVTIYYKTQGILDRLSGGNRHQNIVAEVGKLVPKDLGNMPVRGKRGTIWLVLHHIKDPMNLGAVLRTCAFLGVDRVVVNVRNCCVELTPRMAKASSGGMEWVPIYGVNNTMGFLKAYRTAGWNVIGGTAADVMQDLPKINKSESESESKSETESESKRKGLHTTTDSIPHRTLQNVCFERQNILLIGDDDLLMDDVLKSGCCQLLSLPTPKQRQLEHSLTFSAGTGIMLHSLIKKKKEYLAE